jgi:hypothetical protein
MRLLNIRYIVRHRQLSKVVKIMEAKVPRSKSLRNYSVVAEKIDIPAVFRDPVTNDMSCVVRADRCISSSAGEPPVSESVSCSLK